MTIPEEVKTNYKSFVKADRRVGIAKERLSVHLMQKDKFETAVKCLKSPEKKWLHQITLQSALLRKYAKELLSITKLI